MPELGRPEPSTATTIAFPLGLNWAAIAEIVDSAGLSKGNQRGRTEDIVASHPLFEGDILSDDE